MVNKITYGGYPDKDEFSSLYETHTQKQLCKIYGCSELRVRKWINHFGLELRQQGGGNNRKFDINIEELKTFIQSGKTNEDIASYYKMSVSNLNRLLKKYGLKRNYNTKEYQKYARKVRYLTESTYAKYVEIINPENHPRTLCGVENGYQLDHIVSIRECFDSGTTVEVCADVTNLQMIPWERNLQKRILKRSFLND